MALFNCPECGKQISVNAKKCIHCGFPIPRQTCSQCGNEYNALLPECPICGYNPVKAAEEAERKRKEQEIEAAEQNRLGKEKHDAWWKKNKWHVIISGIVLLCLLMSLFVYMRITDKSDATSHDPLDVAENKGTNDTIVTTQDYVYYPLEKHDAAWRKENGFLLGQIHDEDGYTNIREGKSTKTEILGTIHDGEMILYRKVQGSKWLEVYDLDGAPLGYIHSSRVIPVSSRVTPRKVPKDYIIQKSLILRYMEVTMVLNSHCEGYYYHNARPTERHTLRLYSCEISEEYDKNIVLQEISPSGQIVGEFVGDLAYYFGHEDRYGCVFDCTYYNKLSGETIDYSFEAIYRAYFPSL